MRRFTVGLAVLLVLIGSCGRLPGFGPAEPGPIIAPAVPVTAPGDDVQPSTPHDPPPPGPAADLPAWKDWTLAPPRGGVGFRVTNSPAGSNWDRDGYADNRALYFGQPWQRDYATGGSRFQATAVSPPLYLPPDQEIELDWRDWHVLDSGGWLRPHQAVVAVRVVGGGRHVLTHWWGGSGGNPRQPYWVQYRADLSALAGQTVQIELSFTGGGRRRGRYDGAEQRVYGWFVDDFLLRVNGQTLYQEGFEPPPPVIFLPGSGGSRLVNHRGLLWPHPLRMIWPGGLAPLALAADGSAPANPHDPRYATVATDDIVRRVWGIDFYQDLIDSLAGRGYVEGEGLWVYAYDWRKDTGQALAGLDTLIDAVRAATGSRQVVLLGHSMGGVVARHYISDPERAPKVAALIAVGTPFFGTPRAFQALAYGYNFGIPLLPPARLQSLAGNLSGVYSLLPTPQYFAYNGGYFAHSAGDELLDYAATSSLIARRHNADLLERAQAAAHAMLDLPAADVPHYIVAGSGRATLGQMRDRGGGRVDVGYINGDGTVPLGSADLGAEAHRYASRTLVYYVDADHRRLVRAPAIQSLLANILDGNATPGPAVLPAPQELVGEQVVVRHAASEPPRVRIEADAGALLGAAETAADLQRYLYEGSYDVIGSDVLMFVPPGRYRLVVAAAAAPLVIELRRYAEGAPTQVWRYPPVRIAAGETAALSFSSPAAGIQAGAVSPPLLQIFDAEGKLHRQVAPQPTTIP